MGIKMTFIHANDAFQYLMNNYYSIELLHIPEPEVKKWCEKNFGKEILIAHESSGFLLNKNSRWDFWHAIPGMIYFFKNKEDATLFKLTWR